MLCGWLRDSVAQRAGFEPTRLIAHTISNRAQQIGPPNSKCTAIRHKRMVAKSDRTQHRSLQKSYAPCTLAHKAKNPLPGDSPESGFYVTITLPGCSAHLGHAPGRSKRRGSAYVLRPHHTISEHSVKVWHVRLSAVHHLSSDDFLYFLLCFLVQCHFFQDGLAELNVHFLDLPGRNTSFLHLINRRKGFLNAFIK
jgi:hypothetical protein